MSTKHIQTSDTLSWIKNELDDLVDLARKELVDYVEENQDPSLLNKVKEILQQLRATLETVEIYGASMLAREVSDLVDALINDSVDNRQEAYELLLQAMLLFPDYLEHVQQNNREVPLVLLPHLNDLRTVRNSEPLSAKVLFFPAFNMVKVPVPAKHNQSPNVQAPAKHLRYTFQLGLLGWFRGKEVDENLQRMQKVTSYLYHTARVEASRRLWWIVGAVVQALSTGGLASSVTVKTLLGKVDRQLRNLIDNEEQIFAEQIPDKLINNLLYYLAVSKDSGELVRQVRQAYALAELLPNETKLKGIRDSISGPNADLWHTVAKAIFEDLAEVKDNLEIFVTNGDKNTAFLEKIDLKLHQISDTLAMLGLMEARNKVLEYAAIIRGGIEGNTDINDNTVLSMAGMMLEIESLVRDFASSPEKATDQNKNDVTSACQIESESRLSEIEGHKLLESIIDESNKEIEKVKDLLLEYIESPHVSEQLSVAPQYLEVVRGALLIAGLKTASELANSISNYVSSVILEQQKVPHDNELEILAETITNLECYLEASKRGANNAISYLETGVKGVNFLGFPVGKNFADITPARVDCQDEADSQKQANIAQSIEVNSATEITQSADAKAVVQSEEYSFVEHHDDAIDDESETVKLNTKEDAQNSKQKIPVLSEDVDQEILEIFLEEAKEELETIRQLLPIWQRNSDNYDTLSELRRSFHTLKGSGKLAGAELLGEFAWAYEDLLNRVLERTVPVSTGLSELLGVAVNLLPQLIGQLKGQNFPDLDPYSVIEKTRVLSQQDLGDQKSLEGARKVS